MFFVISLTMRNLHLAANGDDETSSIVVLAARLVAEMTMRFAMLMINKSIYNHPFKVSMNKELAEVVGNRV